MEEREDPSYFVGGNVNWYMENSMEGPWRAESGATIWHSNPTPGHVSREDHGLKVHMHANVHCLQKSRHGSNVNIRPQRNR